MFWSDMTEVFLGNDSVGATGSVEGKTSISEGSVGLAAVANDSCGGSADDELPTPAGLVKAFNRRSLSSTVMPFEAGGLLATLRFGTKMVGSLTVGSTGFEMTGCL